MLTKILLVLVAIVIILLVVAYFTPRNFSLSKSITINAPREKVYEYIRLLKNQEKYSVWVMADTNIAMKYTGTDGTVGATSSWTSEMKNVGVGAQTITALVPNEKVTVEIRFEKPMKATNYADTTLETVGGQTKVTNTFYGTNKFPMNITNLFLDKIIGGDIETNLANLKKNLETSVDDKTPEPEEKKIEETSQASISPSPEEAKQKLVWTWQDADDTQHTIIFNSNGMSQEGTIKWTWTVFTKSTIPKIISSISPTSIQDKTTYLVIVPNKEYDIGVEGFFSIQHISDTSLELVVEPSDIRGGIVKFTKIK